MKIRDFFTLVALLAISISLNAKTESVIYKTTPQQKLKMSIWSPENISSKKGVPAIIFFHGGGWFSGSLFAFKRQAEYFSSRGIVAISVQYRLTNEQNKTTPIECLKDAKSAVRYIKANASRFNIDPERVVVAGGSAGGHLAAATQMCPNINESTDDLNISTMAVGMILLNPVLSTGPETSGPYKGNRHDEVKEQWRDFSPIHNVRKGVPPALYIVGSKDQLIGSEQGPEFKRLVESVGGHCKVKIYEGCAHSFFNIKGKSATGFYETLKDMDEFLLSLGILDGKEYVGEWIDSQNLGLTY